jgi:hypothetical protein
MMARISMLRALAGGKSALKQEPRPASLSRCAHLSRPNFWSHPRRRMQE